MYLGHKGFSNQLFFSADLLRRPNSDLCTTAGNTNIFLLSEGYLERDFTSKVRKNNLSKRI